MFMIKLPGVRPTPHVGYSVHTFFPSHLISFLDHRLSFVQPKSSHQGVPAVALMQNCPSPKSIWIGLLLILRYKHGKDGFHRQVRSCYPLGQQRVLSPELCLKVRVLNQEAPSLRVYRRQIKQYIIYTLKILVTGCQNE